MEVFGMGLKNLVHSLKRYILPVFFASATVSCLSNNKKVTPPVKENSKPLSKEQVVATIEKAPKSAWWKRMVANAEKDRKIYGIFDISKDSVVLLRHSVGVELSADDGKTWTWLGKGIYRIDEFTVDNKGIWWGLEHWEGTHNKPGYCRIHSSNDAGKTWTKYELNTAIFFPSHINSKPGQPLEVTDGWSNKIYLLKGNDASHNWQYVKQDYEREVVLADISVGNYSISDNLNNNKLYVKRDNNKIDTLVSFKGAYNIYRMEMSKNTIYVAGQDTSGKNSYFAVIKNEKLLKEFIIPGWDVNLIKTQFNHIYLIGTNGVCQYKNNSLVNIYK